MSSLLNMNVRAKYIFDISLTYHWDAATVADHASPIVSGTAAESIVDCEWCLFPAYSGRWIFGLRKRVISFFVFCPKSRCVHHRPIQTASSEHSHVMW